MSATIEKTRLCGENAPHPVTDHCPVATSWDLLPRGGPWDMAGAHRFYGGPLSSFAPTLGLRLPEGWYGRPNPVALISVPTVEHYFQACKTCTVEDFRWILSAPSPAAAKRRGGPRGEGGRRIELRPDWEEVKRSVMLFATRRKFVLPGYRRDLLATGCRVLVEDSPRDFIWGGRDRDGGWMGWNLLGITLMEVRAGIRVPEGGLR